MDKIRKSYKFSFHFRKLLKKMNFTPKRAINSTIFFLIFSAIANAVYVFLLANKEEESIKLFFKSNPQNTVMFIISATDFIVGYFLWINRAKITRQRKKFITINCFLLLTQILVGNFVNSVLALLSICIATQIEEDGDKLSYNYETLFLILCGLIYFFSFFVLMKLR